MFSFNSEWAAGDKELSIDETLELPTTTLYSIIQKHANGKWPDYMSIDIEGMDYDVLKSSDLTNGPIAITTEVLNGNLTMTPLMREKGYFPYCRTLTNITYVKKEYYGKLFSDNGNPDECYTS